MSTSHDILDTYLHFRDHGRADTVPLTDTFWQQLADGQRDELNAGRLMTAFEFSEPWTSWERHPAGEELGLLLTGAVSLRLDEGGVERVVELASPGAYVLIGRGVWHTARPLQPSKMLFLTPGAGTEHRPVTD